VIGRPDSRWIFGYEEALSSDEMSKLLTGKPFRWRVSAVFFRLFFDAKSQRYQRGALLCLIARRFALCSLLRILQAAIL
jgi:hypothetical protein